MNTQNDINVQVYALLEDLTAFGMKSAPRGHAVVEANVATLDIDPLHPLMDFEDRKFNWKYFAGELAWYISKDNRIDFINNFSTFWSGLTDTGRINSNYGTILLDVHPSQKDANFDGSGIPGKAYHSQLEWAYNSLKKDKDSRQAVAFLNCPYYQYEGNRDFVCTMYLNFWIRHDRLDMKVQMRSNDIFFGLSYDAPWFSLVHQSMYLELKKIYPELKLGMYYHTADNIHYYERHFDLVEKIITSPVKRSPKFELKHSIFYFDENGKLNLSNEALRYMVEIQSMVALQDKSGKKFTREEWKESLSILVDIQEA
jgi:thymidylate synthase